DYRAVMPLTIKKKAGIPYLFQPFYSQQLGIFSLTWVNTGKIAEFLDAIPSFVRYARINLNYTNDLHRDKYKVWLNSNYELRLGRNYQDIRDGFTDNTRRNIQKSLPFVELTEKITVPDLVRLRRENAPVRRSRDHYEWMSCFVDKVLEMGHGRLVGAIVEDRLVAAAFFAIFGGRVYYLIPVSGDQGKTSRAMFGIVDHIIGTYAGTGLVLDFEGSNIPGIARFFTGFGARETKYNTVSFNRLPLLLRFLKG
ncbi:MAG TPA: hypothetical protein VE870_10695, partial [Bacteroidales bacterium]|nr:hypothetical protein [Bacteroidales bacterium]